MGQAVSLLEESPEGSLLFPAGFFPTVFPDAPSKSNSEGGGLDPERTDLHKRQQLGSLPLEVSADFLLMGSVFGRYLAQERDSC